MKKRPIKNLRQALNSQLSRTRYFSPKGVNIFTYFLVLAIIGPILLENPFFYKDFKPVSHIDALFTTVSAMCVTGLCPIDMADFNIAGLTFLMIVIELGGLGLIAFFTIYIILPARQLSLESRQAAKDYFISDVENNHINIVRQIFVYSIGIQLVGGLILGHILWMDGREHALFYGFFLSVSAFCNAGFAPWTDNLHQFKTDYPLMTVICILIVSGGLGFTVMQDVFSWTVSRLKRLFFGKGKKKKISFHSKIVFLMTVVLIFVPSVFFIILEWDNAFKDFTVVEKIMNAVFQSVTCRTAGFETVDEGTFSQCSAFISEIIMVIGGNPGSMAGGIKTTTAFLILCHAFKSSSDAGRLSIFHRDVHYTDMNKAQAIFTKAIIFVGVIVFALLLSEHRHLISGQLDADDLVFETISAIGTVGLTRGITSKLTAVSKFILVIAMYGGRTGIITLSLAIPSQSQNIKRFVDYPREEVLIG